MRELSPTSRGIVGRFKSFRSSQFLEPDCGRFVRLNIPLIAAALLIFAACQSGGGGEQQSPCDGKSHEYTLNQPNGGVQQVSPASGGPVGFGATFPYPNLPFPCKGHLVGWKNPNPYRIGLITPGHNTGECFSVSAATIVINGGASTTSADMTKFYAQPSPALPQNIAFCAEAGTNPSNVAITVQYTLDKSP